MYEGYFKQFIDFISQQKPSQTQSEQPQSTFINPNTPFTSLTPDQISKEATKLSEILENPEKFPDVNRVSASKKLLEL